VNKKKINQKDKETIERLKKLIDENRATPTTSIQLAEIYAKLKDYSHAGSYYLCYGYQIKESSENRANEVFKKAEYFLKKAIKKNQKDSNSHSNLALTYSALGKHNKAIQSFRKAIEISRSPSDYFYLAREYRCINELHKAAEYYMAAGKEDQKKEHGGYFGHGNLAFEKAVKVYKEIDKNNPKALKEKDFFNLGFACFHCFEYSYEDAANSFKEVIRLNPKNEEAYFYLALSYEELFDYKEALKALKELIRINPEHSRAYYKMYFIYEKLEKSKEARKSLKQALRIDPAYKFNLLNLLKALLMKDDLNQAWDLIKMYKELIELRPDYALGHYDLGELYLSIDNLKNAKKEYEILKNLDESLADKLLKLIKQRYDPHF